MSKGDWKSLSALAAIHLISPKHISFMSVSYWLRLDRSHTLGSSLQLGLVARLGLVAGGDAQVGGDEAGAELCAGGGCTGCSGRLGASS